MMPAATRALLPTQPPEGAAEEVRAGDAAAPSLDPATIAANNTEFEPEPAPVAPPKPKPVEPPKPKVEAPPAPKPEPKPVVEEKAAPTGKAYVVQLGALKNADKVNEIVGSCAVPVIGFIRRHPRQCRVKLPVFWLGRMPRKIS